MMKKIYMMLVVTSFTRLCLAEKSIEQLAQALNQIVNQEAQTAQIGRGIFGQSYEGVTKGISDFSDHVKDDFSDAAYSVKKGVQQVRDSVNKTGNDFVTEIKRTTQKAQGAVDKTRQSFIGQVEDFEKGLKNLFGTKKSKKVDQEYGSKKYKTSKEVMQALFGAHTKAFSKESLVEEKVSEEDSNAWNAFLNGFETFYKENLFGASGSNTKAFNQALDAIKNASEVLVNVARKSHLYFTDKKRDLYILKMQENLKKAKKELEKNKNSLVVKFTDFNKTKELKKLFNNVIKFVDTTIKKLEKDMKKSGITLS